MGGGFVGGGGTGGVNNTTLSWGEGGGYDRKGGLREAACNRR